MILNIKVFDTNEVFKCANLTNKDYADLQEDLVLNNEKINNPLVLYVEMNKENRNDFNPVWQKIYQVLIDQGCAFSEKVILIPKD